MTRMHTVELVCTVALALVLLASARDILEGDAGVIETAATVLEGTIPLEETTPLEGSSGMAAAMSTVTGGPVAVGVNGEVCVDIPPNCQGSTSGGPACPENGGTGASTDKKYATHLKQFCVARSLPGAVPDPTSILPLSCPWTLSPDLPSWCVWPGISCVTDLTTTYNNKCGPIFKGPCPIAPITTACAGGVYIYTVHQAGTGPLNPTMPKQRQGFWASGFEDTYTSPDCLNDSGYCLSLNTGNWGSPAVPLAKRGFGVPTVTAVPGSRYKIDVPRINIDTLVVVSTYTCKIGVDLKNDVIRCNIPS